MKSHLAIVASSLVSGTLLSLATIFAYDPDWECPISIVLAFLVDLIFVYSCMATSVHEMVFCCYAHGLSKVIKCSVDLLQRTEDISSFCSRQKQNFKV